jgi:N-dimethylarginine dimethylaminohydrolase
MKFGSQSEVAPLKSLLLKRPREAFISQKNIQSQWKKLHFLASPNYKKAIEEYDRFMELLGKFIPEIHYLPKNNQTTLDSIYVHDPVLITKKGAILCNMGKAQRQGESRAIAEFLPKIGLPVLGTIAEPGKLEGGDVVWLNEETLAVGRGYRTNAEGIRQLKKIARGLVKEFIEVPLPHWNGPEDVLHLMSLISPIDYSTALVYSRLLPVSFREKLLEFGFKLLEVPDSEFSTMGCNVLAIAPRKCVMLAGNPQTKTILEENGVEVWEYQGKEISFKGEGGPTCLTRPLLRE